MSDVMCVRVRGSACLCALCLRVLFMCLCVCACACLRIRERVGGRKRVRGATTMAMIPTTSRCGERQQRVRGRQCVVMCSCACIAGRLPRSLLTPSYPHVHATSHQPAYQQSGYTSEYPGGGLLPPSESTLSPALDVVPYLYPCAHPLSPHPTPNDRRALSRGLSFRADSC